jgi:hypothetical protein
MCKNFAEISVKTSTDEYFKRNQRDVSKIKKDILLGKVAEWGVYFIYLENNKTLITPPDMNVYSKFEKSFECDLRWGLFRLHVKSQDTYSADRYGTSWVFQKKDPLFVHSGSYDIIIGCRVDMISDTPTVEILLERPFRELKFNKPKLDKFSDNKIVLYLQDNNE